MLFSDYGKGGLTHILRMIGSRARAGKPVLIDPKGNDYGALRRGHGHHTQSRGAGAGDRPLVQRGSSCTSVRSSCARHRVLRGILLTRSGEGISLFDEHGHLQVPAQAREVFDVTGAGDTVIAALAVLMACGVGLRDALPVVNRAGGIVVGKFGAAKLSYEELYP